MDSFWEKNAEAWSRVVSSGGIASREVTDGALRDSVANLRPQSLLDLGCGEGFLSSFARERGISYHGVDGSRNLIDLALDRHGDFFEVASYEDMISGKWRPSMSFDLTVFNFSLFDENLEDLFRAVRGFIKPHGSLIVQTLHPCFALKEYKTGWNTEDFKGMSIPFTGSMNWYGRILGDWLHLFIAGGWELESVKEPILDGRPASIIFELRVAGRRPDGEDSPRTS